MTSEISDLIDGYHRWLKEKTKTKELGEWTEITTPFVDRNNDLIQIYARRDGDDIILTDDGNTISELILSGCDLSSSRRQEILKITLSGFGVKRSGDALSVRTSAKDFPLKKHSLVQSIISISDMFYMSKSQSANFFLEDVAKWLDESNVRYIESPKFSGSSGFDHLFNFVIPKSQDKPERILRVINQPTRAAATNFAFAWVDTKDARHVKAQAYAILNDDEKKVGRGVTEALNAYGISPIAWSDRGNVVKELAA